jgi:hypothetical protein
MLSAGFFFIKTKVITAADEARQRSAVCLSSANKCHGNARQLPTTLLL